MDTQAAPESGTSEKEGEPNGRPRTPVVGYYLDESDPDIMILRRRDGTFVAAFSASGATREGICEAAENDYYRASGDGPPR